jgi:hypothetical protein
VKRSVRLKLIDGNTVELREGVPASRAECKDGPRPCGYVRCKFHLWRIDAEDREGNPQFGNAGTTLRPAWLEWPTPPSCALDLADAGETEVREIARAMGMHRGNVWLIWSRVNVRAAFEALKRHIEGEHDELSTHTPSRKGE